VLCAQNKTIQHLFFDCHYAKFIWTAVHIAFNIQNPIFVLHLFDNWAYAGGHINKRLMLSGVVALIWAL
jgi:hypothetical protein